MYQTAKEGIADVAKWYHEHRDDGRSIEQTIDFMKKTMDCVIDVLALKVLETEQRSGGSRLYLPRLAMQGDLTREG